MTPEELEGAVEWYLGKAGFSRKDRPSASAIAKARGVPVIMNPNARALGTHGLVEGRFVVYIRSSLNKDYPRKQHVVAHELGHDLLTMMGVEHHEESWCDYLGAAMILRRDAVRVPSTLADLSVMAASVRTTETLAALRVGEVYGEPVAIVTPGRVYARGNATWPHEPALRRWVPRPPPMVSVERLPDDRHRWLIRPKEVE